MSNVWQRLEECLYFCRRYGLGLLGILLPVAVPAFLLKNFRAWWALGFDQTLIDQDVLIMALGLLVGLFSSAVTIIYAARIVKNEAVPPAQVRREALLTLAPFFLVQMLVAFASMGGMIFFIVPGFWVLACLMPAYVYVVADKLPVMQALQTSFHTFRPMAWQVLGSLIVLVLLLLVALTGIGVLTDATDALVPWARMLANAGLDTVALALMQLFPILLVRFYDLGREQAAQAGITER